MTEARVEDSAVEGGAVEGAELPVGRGGASMRAATRSDMCTSPEVPDSWGEHCVTCGAYVTAKDSGICHCDCVDSWDWYIRKAAAPGRCRARSSTTGGQCRSKGTLDEDGFCRFHPMKADEAGRMKEVRKKAGQASIRKKAHQLEPNTAPDRVFHTEQDVLKLLGDTANGVAKGRLETGVAETLRRLAADMMKALDRINERGAGRTPEADGDDSSEEEFVAGRIGSSRDASGG
ncbi:MAG: hypothetical protein GWO44_16285 [Thermoplasmata archaeon]|nr:hypothetical protein [Thermoplasmata archaeon]NIY04762.1 hypothetical protein [Thermoplasmata archaeon]